MWLLSNKVSIRESGLLEGFMDCHCHLLPGVDDGVQEVKETMQILKLWEQAGVSEVWLTPHIMEDVPNKTAELKQRIAELETFYQGAIKLHLAAENMMDRLFLDRLAAHDLLTIGKDETRLLVETSYYNPPMDMEWIIDQIRENGYTPILAHPERYQYMRHEDYGKWKQKGVLLQLNLPSLTGAYGSEVAKKAEMLLDKGMYDYCGTDTHSMRFVEYFLNSKIAKKTVKKVQEIAARQEL